MEKQYEDDEIEIDLKEMFFELLNNWVMIVVSAVLVGAIAFCVSKFIMTPQYQSTSEMYVLTKSTSLTSLADIQTGTNLTNDYIVVVTGRPVLEQVIENLDLDMTYSALKENVSVTNPSNSRILQITVTDDDPNQAKLIVDEIADVSAQFIADKMDQEAPNIIQYGYVNKGAVSPNTVTNTLLGVVIGAFVAIAIIIISYLLNDTIMTVEDVERKLGLNVLGALPLTEAEYNGDSRKKKNKTVRKVQKAK